MTVVILIAYSLATENTGMTAHFNVIK